LEDLKLFFVGGNKLNGPLPVEMGRLEKLERLVIDDNSLSGDPAPIFNKLTNLRDLYADNNEFSGLIDENFLRSHHKLEKADLSGNSFLTDDGIPAHLFGMRKLDTLDLSKNRLVGHISKDIPKNTVLKFLSLYENMLDGGVPSELTNLEALEHLDLSDNDFHGPIRHELGQMSSLKFLFLSENPDFHAGPIPEQFGNLTKLEDLSMRNTNRTGPLPEFLGSMTSLSLLDLSFNGFRGNVPDKYAQLKDLEYLLLNANDITGHFPKAMGELSGLRAAFLDGTLLKGDLDFMCPIVEKSNGNELVYADCLGPKPEVNCTCCECCYPSDVGGCSKPFVANLDGSWENSYRRSIYRFDDDISFQNRNSMNLFP
jgi:Leucine-rich repeat (LRR) protein